VGGRVLIAFTAVLLAVMPWTEYFYDFDKFLRGGQDCEFGLLTVATILLLVLVLLHQRKQALTFMLTAWRWLSSVFGDADLRVSKKMYTSIAALQAVPMPSRRSSLYNPPLQI
jgi:hypothetical protein